MTNLSENKILMLYHRTNQFLEVGLKGTKDVSVLFKWNINLGTYKYENNSFFGHLLTQRLLHSSTTAAVIKKGHWFE